MHLKITYIVMFELLFSRNIVFLYLKDWEVVQKKKKGKYVVEQRGNGIYANQSFLFIS